MGKKSKKPGTDKPYQMSVDANKQVFLGGTTKDTLVFNDDLAVGTSNCWRYYCFSMGCAT